MNEFNKIFGLDYTHDFFKLFFYADNFHALMKAVHLTSESFKASAGMGAILDINSEDNKILSLYNYNSNNDFADTYLTQIHTNISSTLKHFSENDSTNTHFELNELNAETNYNILNILNSYGYKNSIISIQQCPVHTNTFSLLSFINPSHKLAQNLKIALNLLNFGFMIGHKKLSNNDRLESIFNLTPKEKLVAKWIIEGKSAWSISQILGCSESTVKFHTRNIYKKFNVTTRAQAVVKIISLSPYFKQAHYKQHKLNQQPPAEQVV